MPPHPHGSRRTLLRASRRTRYWLPGLDGLERRLVLTTAAPPAASIDFSGGFNGATGLALNGAAQIFNYYSSVRLTDGGELEASSAFATTPVPVSQFSTQFSFLLWNSAPADGFAFVIQGVGPTALGQAGGGLGYGPSNAGGTGGIPNSVAVKFDLYDNAGEGPDSTGLYTGGAAPMGNSGSVDLRPLGLDLHSGHVFNAALSYDGSVLTEVLTDTTTGASTTQSYRADIPGAVGGSSGYVGFTAGTGYSSAFQDIRSWTYTPNVAATPPAAPSELAATVVSGTQANLAWSDNSNNETGFKIERRDPGGASFNVIATVPAGTSTFIDSTLSPITQYYYRVQATNDAGDSAPSNEAMVTTPVVPVTPSQARTTLVTANQIGLAWYEGGNNETGFQIFRRDGAGGAYNLVATLPASATSYNDTGLSPATSYDYHIAAYNLAGNSGFADLSVLTSPPAPPQAPTGASAIAGNGTVTLSWGAVAGAASYNVYRATTSGGEGPTPLATGLTTPSYTDTGLINGATYYYVATAVGSGGESTRSGEVHATPASVGSQASMLNDSGGFAGATGLSLNGSARIDGNVLRLTDGGAMEAGAAFASTPVPVSQFTTQFYFQLTNPDADGFAFVIQRVAAGAMGQAGGALGYGPMVPGGTGGIPSSVALKFDLYDNAGEGPDSTGLYTGGVAPMASGSVDLRPYGLDLHSGHVFNASLSYNGTVLTEVLTDTTTGVSATKSYNVDIVGAVGRSSAYVGFTAGTGYSTAVQDIRSWTYSVPPVNLPNGFAGATGLALNGSAKIAGNVLRLTDGGAIEAGSTFASTPVPVSPFTTEFSFQLTNANADGFAFVIQGVGPNALGQAGGGLGYGAANEGGTGGIPKSISLKFDLYDNGGEGPDSTGLNMGGYAPMELGSVDLRPLGLDLHSGHVFHVSLSYDGSVLTEVLTDSATGAAATKTYTVDIVSAVGGSSAYVGFTAGTGYSTAVQDILSWTYASTSTATPPTAPSQLTATPVSGIQVNLAWTDNANDQTGYAIERQDSPGGPFNVIDTIGARVPGFGDATTPGHTYTYRVCATNGAGVSAPSNAVTVATPSLPATPSQLRATLVTATRIDLSWQDNANNESGYYVYRGGEFYTPVATLPASATTYSDTGLAPGTLYDYQVQAFGAGGRSDLATVSVPTVPAAPLGVSAVPADGQVALNWYGMWGATSYNVYRAASSGAEGMTPLAAGLRTPNFTDTGLADGTTYYYEITAVNAGGESVRSPEVSAVPGPAASQGGVLNYSNGFAGATGLAVNGAETLANGVLRLTDGDANEAASAFVTARVPVSQFTTQFSFQLTDPGADGFAFVIQGVGPTALGRAGGGLGYAFQPGGTNGIGSSVAVKFDLYDNAGEGPDSTGLYMDAAAPTGSRGSVDLRSSGLDLHSGHIFNVSLSYDGSVLTEILTDTATGMSTTNTYTVDIVGTVGGASAYVGFTAGTGWITAVQDIRTWTYTPGTIATGATTSAASLSGTAAQSLTTAPAPAASTLSAESPIVHTPAAVTVGTPPKPSAPIVSTRGKRVVGMPHPRATPHPAPARKPVPAKPLHGAAARQHLRLPGSRHA